MGGAAVSASPVRCTSRADADGGRTYFGPSPSDVCAVSPYCMWQIRVPKTRVIPNLSDAAALLLGRALVLQSQHGGFLPMDDRWMGGVLGWQDDSFDQDFHAYMQAFDELTDAGLVWQGGL